MIDRATFNEVIETQGWIVIPNVITNELTERMAKDLEICYEKCRSLQKKSGIDSITSFTLHHLIGQADSFLEYLDIMPVAPLIEEYFGGKYILNSFGGAINTTQQDLSYAHNIHRDIRSFSGPLKLMLNTLVMLDDFTPENGATWLMNGSHKAHPLKPSTEDFKPLAKQATGPKGSVLIFNSNVWHCGGLNTTNKVRRSVTPMFTKPFYKPQFDYCRALGYDKVEQMPDHLKQVLGFYSRVPTSLEEWYQPPEKRAYRPDQG